MTTFMLEEVALCSAFEAYTFALLMKFITA